MIPTLLLVGLLAGRWYVVALAAVAWPLLLTLLGVADLAVGDWLVAAALAAANTAVGVAVHRSISLFLRRGLSRLRTPHNGAA
jgi:hypothetical protein